MCSKGVWQLKQLTVRFCAHSGGSAGTREFLRTELAAFAEANPQLEVAAEGRSNRPALLRGKYVCGSERQVEVSNMSASEVLAAASALRDQTGRKVTRVRENVKSSSPSIQGMWDPTTQFDAFAIRV
ncbi:hypothetical protein FNF27_03610 [Cafeteria roenbergensis]|uniref:Large ribosomal subunit protein mL43 n=2 Tax=Cafeteria roenbergensis TaxID=33653 RepID=A0A5A8CBI6_CAFRO|nr:hypothetical protein FNF29_05265 [Cafeteria roenbergensis]KAA0162032.1 hypothetical protein FNF31_03443 [Cafeteria roenbergensis]KAA0167658.1 hypothetical protein FNF28_02726 [Cafeteria roenbergensis]KAA0174895.1 hypothetical protein FNF27_03610 [Cafeteria roenbergensis]|eukprot:KAA0150462.1 hypothetical protein FNF29_05265 [Cafeteria roenbergensis]